MNDSVDYKDLIERLGFIPKENTADIYLKEYTNGYIVELDFKKKFINYGKKIKADSKTTQNFSQDENWVVLECVNRLLEKGYQPKNITLEKTWASGHGTSGRLDICVTRDDGSEFLLIECKTWGSEFDKELAKMNKNGGQLFTYFKFSNKADAIMLYASKFDGQDIVYKNEIIKIEDEYRAGDVKDFYDKWNKLTKDNGIFDSWVSPYNFVSKALTPGLLEPIKPEDSSFIFNRFLEILRHNVVSDKPNAFNKIFTLFLCKIYDEKTTRENEELKFQWLDGIDDDISFQMRLTDLYKNGMFEFLEKRVTDFSTFDFETKYKNLDKKIKDDLLKDIIKLRLEKNNEFAIKEVFDSKSFVENSKVVKQVVELLQGYKIRYSKKQQYLSDFFELLLTTGLKQESGQFFTPVPIAQFIIKSIPIDELIDEKLNKGERNNLLPYVIDYAAGSGHFLTEMMHEVQRAIDNKNAADYIADTAKKINTWQEDHFDWALQYIYGIEKDYRLVKVGKVGCYLHGDGLANVIHSDGLGNFKNTEEYKDKLSIVDNDFEKENKQFDIVASNPPYSVSAFKQNARTYYTENDFELYDYFTDNSSEIECLFIERTKQLLKDNGMAGIILPSSILSNAGIYTKAREIILQNFDIIAIAELGSNTFMATGTNTVTLFLRRKNNYFSINLRKSIDLFFTNLQDVTLNGIEKPVSKYIANAWNDISFSDYQSLLSRKPNKAMLKQDLYREYQANIKAKKQSEKLDEILRLEKEKIFYFVITYPQKVVLVKSGGKKAEKQFLGYEFSTRRGSEGIHSTQSGKSIDECTQLFDADVFDNPEKASTYIYKAFKGEYSFPISENLRKNICHADLVNMLTFDRVDFEKNISISSRIRIDYEKYWGTSKLNLLSEIADIKKGTTITQAGTTKGDIPVIAGGKEPAYFHNKYNRLGNIITISASGAYSGYVNYFKEPIFASDCNTIASKDEKVISTRLIYLFLKSIQSVIYGLQRGQAQPHVYSDDLAKIKLPTLSPELQSKIISEVSKLQKQEQVKREQIESLQSQIVKIINDSKGSTVKLKDITSKIGSGATPRGGEASYKNKGINFIRSQNVYDFGMIKKGLVFIDDAQAKKLKVVTVMPNDVLFNITGASVCRCCIVEPEYLPARVNQHVAIIRANHRVQSSYLHHILVSPQIKDKLLKIAELNSTREAITKLQLEEFKIPLPPLTEQNKIVKKIDKIESKITKLNNEIKSFSKNHEAIIKKYLIK